MIRFRAPSSRPGPVVDRAAVSASAAGGGVRVLAVTNMYPSPERPAFGVFLREQIRSLERSGVEMEVLLIDRLKEGARSYFGVPRRLLPRLERFNPHLVHVLYGGVLADRVTRAVRDRPVVVTYHGSDLQGSRLARYRVRLMARYGVWCSRRAALGAAGIILVAEHLLRFLPAGIDPTRVRVIPCGVDFERFSPQDPEAARRRLGWEQSRFHVLFATSNDDPIKRPELARAAVHTLRNLGVDVELHVLCGVPYDEVPTWLSASDAVLLTSLTEGSPTIIKEALACERPVVSVAVGDVPQQIEGIAGCYLAEPNSGSLAEMLGRVNEGSRRIEAREKAARYDSRRIAEQLTRFYQELAGGGRGCAAPAG